uniref:Large ribosomal subunit protein uL23c n=1 Tax=Antrophyum semicostatum TaxID=1604141 RepID=A0A3G5CTT4_9MONI|nr:ribosomal protein L23 [Antrophyum semicostatum]AYW16289.1 ribosomal protein L23 [Antrophyum semicostatum]
MDKLENQLISEKSIRLLQQNQYTFTVDSKSTKTEMRNRIEQLFEVKVEGTNSSSIRTKSAKKGNKSTPNFANCKKMIVRLKENYYIPSFLKEL